MPLIFLREGSEKKLKRIIIVLMATIFAVLMLCTINAFATESSYGTYSFEVLGIEKGWTSLEIGDTAYSSNSVNFSSNDNEELSRIVFAWSQPSTSSQSARTDVIIYYFTKSKSFTAEIIDSSGSQTKDTSNCSVYGDYYYFYTSESYLLFTDKLSITSNFAYQPDWSWARNFSDHCKTSFFNYLDGKEIDANFATSVGSSDFDSYIDNLNPPSDMSMSVTDYCTNELKGGNDRNDNVIVTFTMYPDDYIDGSIFKTNITLYYDVPIYNNLTGMDSIKWEVKHPFTSRYQTKQIKLEFDYILQPDEIKKINERKEKYDFEIKISKSEIYSKMEVAVANLDYKDCKKWVIADKNLNAVSNGVFTYEKFIPLKKIETKNMFYLESTGQRTPYFYLDTTMKLYANDDVMYSTDGVTTNKTVGEQEIFDYTDKDGNNTEWADSVDFDPEQVLANESGYSWDSTSNHKNFIGVLVDLFESIKDLPRFMKDIMFYMPEFFFTITGVVLTIIVVMRILGR